MFSSDLTNEETPRVTFFTRSDCHLCHAAEYVILRVAANLGVQMERIDIDEPGQEEWKKLYTHDIPVVHINGVEHARHHVEERKLRDALDRATLP